MHFGGWPDFGGKRPDKASVRHRFVLLDDVGFQLEVVPVRTATHELWQTIENCEGTRFIGFKFGSAAVGKNGGLRNRTFVRVSWDMKASGDHWQNDLFMDAVS
jgi:hypothetical protein